MIIDENGARQGNERGSMRRPPRDLGRRLLRAVVRLPLWLYRALLGWLLGERFLRLTHRGRRTGQPHQTVLEVVAHNRPSDTYVVVAGLGERAQWFRNVRVTPEVTITVGHRELEATAERLDADEAEPIMRDYLRRHPLAFRLLARLLLGWQARGTAEDACRMARRFPLVALRPRG